MALRDQPYFPLYVQDYLTDEKLNMCMASSQGVYIKILCLFHKSDSYGGILLKQKDKQDKNIVINFAKKLAKLLPFEYDIIVESLEDLIEEKVLIIDNDFIYQKRMIKDNELSLKRANAGKKGGVKTQNNNKEFAKAKSEANSENEYESEDVIKDNNKGVEKFNEFWEEFHSITGKTKTDKEPALKHWKKLKANEQELAIKNIKYYFSCLSDKKYCKKARTYLSDKNFNDEIQDNQQQHEEKQIYISKLV